MKRFIVLALLLLLASPALAQVDARIYGAFLPGDPSHFPKQDAIAIWDNLDPGWTGDMLQGAGNYEEPFVVDATCGFCPAGATCFCQFDSTIVAEPSKIFKGSQSIKYVSPTGWTANVVNPLPNLDPGSYYQISFWAKGEVGGEDLELWLWGQPAPYGATPDVYYLVASDTWGAVWDIQLPNITTTWTQYTYYVRQNVGSQLQDVFFEIRRDGGAATFYVDNLQVVKLNNTSQVSAPGNYTFAPAVTSDPVYAGARGIQVIAGQRTKRGMLGDGVDDYMVMATEDNKFDAAETGNISVCVEATENSVVANAQLVAKDAGVPQKSWNNYISGASLAGYISKDGGLVNVSTVSKAIDTTKQFASCMTYTRVADGSSIFSICANHEAACGSIANAVSPIFNSTAVLSVFDRADGGSTNWGGSISRVGIYRQALSAANISRWVSPYFAKSIETTGMYVTTCAQAASHAICDPSKCVDGTANRCVPDSQWQPIFGQYTEICDYNSFETVVGGDDAPAFTGWTVNETPATGTAEVTAYRADTMHGNVAVRIKTTGIGTAEVVTPCMTTGIGSVTKFYVAAKKLRDTPTQFFPYIMKYSDGACVNMTDFATIYDGDVKTVWDWYGGTVTGSWVGVNSYNIAIVSVYGGSLSVPAAEQGTDLLADTASIVVSPVRVPWTHAAGAADVVVNARDYRVHNPLADVKPNGRYAYQDGFCAGMWVSSDWVANDGIARYLAYVTGTVGAQNNWNISKSGGNVLNFAVYDGAAANKQKTLAVTSANWTVGYPKYVEVCSSNTGTINARHYDVGTSTWYDWFNAGGAGTGIQVGQTANIAFNGGTGTNQMDGYLGPLVIGPYSSTWPRFGFDRRPRQQPY